MDTAPLQVAGIENVGICVERLILMDMPESPVLIALTHQILQRTGRVRIVAGAAIARRVQNANIEPASAGSRVRCREVFWDCPIGEATTVDRYLQVVEQNCIG